jgi:hypothetical protein
MVRRARAFGALLTIRAMGVAHGASIVPSWRRTEGRLMALIKHFEPLDLERTSLHEEVEARYAVHKIDGVGFVQINTYGRPGREIPGKVSQTIQLDRSAAKQLVSILTRAFDL